MFLQAFEIPSILSVQTTSEKSAGTSISAIDIERVMKGGNGGEGQNWPWGARKKSDFL